MDQKLKRRTWRLHTNPTPLIQSWICVHPNDVIYFQDVGEMNGIHVPFTIGIQTPMQLQAMFQFNHKGLISMDATFSTNNVKYLLFTLMVFDFHRTGVPIICIIMNWQTCEGLVRWLKTLRANLLLHMPNWKPSCFILDDAPHELQTLQ